MKIAILFHSNFGNTKKLAEFMAEKILAHGHEVQLFQTTKSNPKNLLEFQPSAILVGGPTLFGKPARKLSKYITKMGKLVTNSPIQKAAVFNCYTGDVVCEIIQEQLSEALPNIGIFDKSLAVRTGNESGENWKEVALAENWEEETNSFIIAFMSIL